jgi:hypothetical protein
MGMGDECPPFHLKGFEMKITVKDLKQIIREESALGKHSPKNSEFELMSVISDVVENELEGCFSLVDVRLEKKIRKAIEQIKNRDGRIVLNTSLEELVENISRYALSGVVQSILTDVIMEALEKVLEEGTSEK